MSALIIAVVGILMAVTLATALVMVVDADIRRMERTAASSRAWATALQPYFWESTTTTVTPHRHRVKRRVMSRPNDPYPGWQP